MKKKPTIDQSGIYKGRGYTLTNHHLQWHAHGEVGPIGIPVKDGMLDELAAILRDGTDFRRDVKYFAT